MRSPCAATKTQCRQSQANDTQIAFKNVSNALEENMGLQGPLNSGGRREATDPSGGAEGGIARPLRAAREAPHARERLERVQFTLFQAAQFSLVVQSLGRFRLFAIPWTVARQVSLSITDSQTLLKVMSTESVMLSHPLSSPSPAFNLAQRQSLF